MFGLQRKVQLSTWSLSALLFLYSCTKIVTTKPRIKAWHVDHVDVMKLPELTYFTEYFAGLLHCFLLRQLGNLGHLEETVGSLSSHPNSSFEKYSPCQYQGWGLLISIWPHNSGRTGPMADKPYSWESPFDWEKFFLGKNLKVELLCAKFSTPRASGLLACLTATTASLARGNATGPTIPVPKE